MSITNSTGYNHHDAMDTALAPIEAQRDDALEELAKVQAQNAALLAALERIVSEGWTERGAFSVQIAREAIANAKGGE